MTFGLWRTVGLRIASLFGGTAFHFSHSFFHLFSRFERDHELLGNKDFITRSRVASFASGPSFDFENAEISQFDAMILDEGLDDGIEGLLDDFLRFELCETNLFRDGFDNLFFGHDGVPYETGQMDETAFWTASSLMSQV